MWFGFKEDTTWYPLSIQRVNEILALNQKGTKVYSLTEDEEELGEGPLALNDDLERMDKRFNEKDKRKKKKKKKKPAANSGAGNGVEAKK